MTKQKSFVENNDGREKDDFYRTPAPCTLALCDELKRHGIEPDSVVDIGCGDGAIGSVVREIWPSVHLVGYELDITRGTRATYLCNAHKPPTPIYSAVFCEDWATASPSWMKREDLRPLFISNPPFKHALRFLELALSRVRPGGHVAFLFPSQWDQETNQDANGRPRERGRFLDRLRLPDGREGYGKLNYEGRVPFRGDNATDRITYTWYVFGPGFEGVHCRIPRYAVDTAEQLRIEGT